MENPEIFQIPRSAVQSQNKSGIIIFVWVQCLAEILAEQLSSGTDVKVETNPPIN